MRWFAKLFSFEGTLKRTPFVWFVVGCAFFVWAASLLDERVLAPWRGFLPGEVGAGSPLAIAAVIMVSVPLAAAMLRRLHAHGKSGWWLLIGLTGIGILPLLYWFFMRAPKN